MSELFPQLDKRLSRRFLRTGMHVPSKRTDLGQVAKVMESLGLVTVTLRRYIKCVNLADDDYLDLVNSNCEGIVELENGGPYICPECGRTIEYPAVNKVIFEDLRVTLNQEGVANHLFAALEALDIVSELNPIDRIAAGITLSDGRSMIIPIVDFAGAGWRASGQDAQKIHAYVIASPINQPPREYLERAYHVELADILANDRAWLANALAAAAQPRNIAFISYSHEDASFVNQLAEDLVASGVGVWLDRWEIKVGDSISDRIQSGLQESDYLLVVLSPNSVNSPWVCEELSVARVRQLESRRVIVLPVLYQDCEIPALLRDKLYADCRGERYNQGLQKLLVVLAPSPEIGAPTPVHWGRWNPKAQRVPEGRLVANATDRIELHRELFAFVCDHFDEEDLRTLCFDLDVGYDDLPARGRRNKARELIAYLKRRGRLRDLVELLNEEHPEAFVEAGFTF